MESGAQALHVDRIVTHFSQNIGIYCRPQQLRIKVTGSNRVDSGRRHGDGFPDAGFGLPLVAAGDGAVDDLPDAGEAVFGGAAEGAVPAAAEGEGGAVAVWAGRAPEMPLRTKPAMIPIRVKTMSSSSKVMPELLERACSEGRGRRRVVIVTALLHDGCDKGVVIIADR